MSDLASIGLAVLDAQEVHGAAELVIALDHLLDNSGGWIVALAFIAAAYRIGMRVVERWSPPRRRAADVSHGAFLPDDVNNPPQKAENTPRYHP